MKAAESIRPGNLLSLSDVGELLGMTEKQVAAHMHRGRMVGRYRKGCLYAREDELVEFVHEWKPRPSASKGA